MGIFCLDPSSCSAIVAACQCLVSLLFNPLTLGKPLMRLMLLMLFPVPEAGTGRRKVWGEVCSRDSCLRICKMMSQDLLGVLSSSMDSPNFNEGNPVHLQAVQVRQQVNVFLNQ